MNPEAAPLDAHDEETMRLAENYASCLEDELYHGSGDGFSKSAREALSTHLRQRPTARLEAGWVMVPSWPTPEMRQAGTRRANQGYDSAASVYAAMLAAAPSHQTAAPSVKAGDAWLPIETAPKDGTRFLARHRSGYVDVRRWQHGADGRRPEGWRDDVMFIIPPSNDGLVAWSRFPAAPAGTPGQGADHD